MEISVPTVFKVEFKDKIRDKRGGAGGWRNWIMTAHETLHIIYLKCSKIK